jgi:drug/metabolite transporter (DMT)-like permease
MPLHQTTGNWRLGLSLTILTVVLWGLVPIALAVVLVKLDVYTVNWFRFLTSFLLLTGYLGYRRQLPSMSQLKIISPGLLIASILGLAGNYLFFVKGLQATSPSHAEVLIQLAGFFLGLGGMWIFKERYNRYQWMGVGVLFTGFIGFFYEQLRVAIAMSDRYLWGSFMLIIAAFSWAFYGLAQKQLLAKLTSAQIMWMIYGGCGLIFGFFAQPRTLIELNPLQWGMLIFCGLNTIIAYGSFAESLQHWEASRVSAVLTLAPIVTIVAMTIVAKFFPGLVHPEYIPPLGLVGAILVVIGSMSIALGSNVKRHNATNN